MNALQNFTSLTDGVSPLTIDFANQNATALRWDVLAAELLSEDDYDAYMAEIERPLQDFAAAQHEARLQQYAAGATGVIGHHVRKKMRFHRARLQAEKARAFAQIFNKAKEAIAC